MNIYKGLPFQALCQMLHRRGYITEFSQQSRHCSLPPFYNEEPEGQGGDAACSESHSQEMAGSRKRGEPLSPGLCPPDLLPSSGNPCCPSHPTGKAPTYGSALERLGVEKAELHVGQGGGAGAGPGTHAGVHAGDPLQQPEDTAVTLERVPTEVPGARGRGGAATRLPHPEATLPTPPQVRVQDGAPQVV